MEKGAGMVGTEIVGQRDQSEQVAEIAEMKMKPTLNARDIEHASRIIEGTARSAGIEVVD